MTPSVGKKSKYLTHKKDFYNDEFLETTGLIIMLEMYFKTSFFMRSCAQRRFIVTRLSNIIENLF